MNLNNSLGASIRASFNEQDESLLANLIENSMDEEYDKYFDYPRTINSMNKHLDSFYSTFLL